MAKKDSTICFVVCYTLDGKPHKIGLTKKAKRSLISKMKYAVTSRGFKDVKGSLKVVNKKGKVISSFAFNNLKPFIREL